MNFLQTYELFHKEINLQKRIIGEKNFTYRNLIHFLNKYLSTKKTILDIGCGVGTIDFYLRHKGFTVTGTDISENAIRMCKKNVIALGFRSNLCFFQLNFPTENIYKKYDFVICSEVLEHLENDGLAIKKIFKILNSGGISILSVPSKNSILHKFGLAKKFDDKVGHVRRYFVKDLETLIDQTDFKIIEILKTEGVFRNVLFLCKRLGIIVRVLNEIEILSDLFTFIDNLSIRLFGESNIFIIVQKK